MYYRTTCSTAFRAKVLARIVVMVLVCLWPRASVAQDVLPIQWLYSPISQVNSVTYSPDGTLLAVGGNGGIQILNAATGALLTCIPTACSTVNSVAFSPDGRALAVGGFNYVPNHDYVSSGVLELWNVSTGMLIYALNTAANFAVYSVAFSPDGNTLADGGIYVDEPLYSGGVLELWSVSTGTLIRTLNTANGNGVCSVAFSPDGKTLADGGGLDNYSGVLELWNVSDGTLITTFNTGAYSIESVAFSPDGKTLAVGGYNPSLHNGVYTGVLELWNVAKGTLITSLYSLATTVNSVTFSPDGKTLADGGPGKLGGVLELWNISTGKRTPLNTAASTVWSVAFSPDGNTLADGGVGISNGYYIVMLELWKVSKGTLITSLNTTADTGVTSVALSPDGKTLAIGGSYFNPNNGVTSGVLELWNISTGTLIKSLPTAAEGIASVTFSPDGKTLADGGFIYNTSTEVAVPVLELWNVSTGTLIKTLNTAALFVFTVAFSPDGKTLIDDGYGGTPGYPSFGVLELWKVSTTTLIYSLNTAAIYIDDASVAFSPDGKTLADGGYISSPTTGVATGVLELRNASTGNLITTLPTATNLVYSVAFSPDGKTLADGGYAVGGLGIGVLELWNASGARLPSPSLVPGTHSVLSVAFSPDGQVLFAGTGYGSLPTNLQAFSMVNYGLLSYYDQGTEGGVVSVAVSSSGSLLAYGTGTGAIVVASNPYYNVTVPSPTSLNPNSAKEGGAAFTLTVKGSGFVTGSTVNWNGTPLTTTFVSSKQVTASVPASDIAEAGTASVTVVNPGNAVSSALTFTIQAVAPTLTSLSPGSTAAGGADFTLTVNGNHFVNGATVNWNGTPLKTTSFVSSTQLTAPVPAANITSAGTASITATNPGTAASNALTFTIKNNPKPTLTSISPNSAKHGSSSLTITLTGSNFLSGSVVNWTAGGTTTELTTTYVSSTQLTATVTSDLLANAGTATVTVFNPAPGGGTSAGKMFTIR